MEVLQTIKNSITGLCSNLTSGYVSAEWLVVFVEDGNQGLAQVHQHRATSPVLTRIL
jgi:hypothetical protein